jgi:hypothetical protein
MMLDIELEELVIEGLIITYERTVKLLEEGLRSWRV